MQTRSKTCWERARSESLGDLGNLSLGIRAIIFRYALRPPPQTRRGHPMKPISPLLWRIYCRSLLCSGYPRSPSSRLAYDLDGYNNFFKKLDLSTLLISKAIYKEAVSYIYTEKVFMITLWKRLLFFTRFVDHLNPLDVGLFRKVEITVRMTWVSIGHWRALW